MERRLRLSRAGHARRVESSLSEGRASRLGLELSSALALQAAATFALVFILLSAAGYLGPRAWIAVPESLRAGARSAFLAAPWLAGGSLAASLLRRG